MISEEREACVWSSSTFPRRVRAQQKRGEEHGLGPWAWGAGGWLGLLESVRRSSHTGHHLLAPHILKTPSYPILPSQVSYPDLPTQGQAA